MCYRRRFFLGLLVGLVLAPSPACAEGWSLWPFSSGHDRDSQAIRKSTNMSYSSGFKPESMMTKVSNGTQRFFTSTKEALSIGGSSKKSTRSQTTKRSRPESSWWKNWGRQDEAEKPATVSEWLAQKRPE